MTDPNDTRTRSRSILPLLVGLPLIAIVAVVAIVLTSGGSGDQSSQTPSRDEAPEGQANPSTTAETDTEGAIGTPTLGEANAPVVMMEFSDYQ